MISWVWDESKAAGIDRLVLLAIADAASDDGGNAYPSIGTLAKKAGVAERTVQRAIRALCELGELTMTPNAGRHGANMYRVVIRQQVALSQSRPVSVTAVAETPPGVRESSGGVNESRNPRPGVTQSVLDPSRSKSARTPFCDQHPNGTDDDCRRCARRRVSFDAAKKAQENFTPVANSRVKNCHVCGGDGWLLDREGKPMAKCTHPDKMASAR